MSEKITKTDEECTAIVPDDYQQSTYMDVGSAGNAGAIFSAPIHGGQ